MKNFKYMIAAFMSTALVACGGGSSDSSFTSTITMGNIVYQCSSEAAHNACADKFDCSDCSSNQPKPNPAEYITASCKETNNKVTVTQEGCIVNSSNKQTAVCSSSSLYLLTGTNLTAQSIISSGASFSGTKGLSINGKTLTCN